jgi:hypothetical protein
MARFSKDFWQDLIDIKVPQKKSNMPTESLESLRIKTEALQARSLGQYNEVSQEALGEVVNEPPPTGNDDDASPPTDTASNDDEVGDGPGGEEGGMEGEGDELGGDAGMPEEGGGAGPSGSDSFSSSGSKSVLDPSDRPGRHPFAEVNGRELLSTKIRELASGLADAIEMIGKVPKIRSVVINDLMELQAEVSRLGEIVYMVPIEATMTRYRLCVENYNLQLANLVKTIDEIINSEE